MSPVLSSLPATTPAGFPARRRAPTTSVNSGFLSGNPETPALLFPECPDHSPNQRTEALAPLCGPRSAVPEFASHTANAGCPPQLPASAEPVVRSEEFRKGTAFAVPGSAHETAAPLVGIARLASISPSAPSHRKSDARPDYFFLPVKSILNRCESNRVPFDWTINPYRGCEFACKYCYARYTHEFMELDGLAFEKQIYVKKDAAVLLAREIAAKYSFAKGHGGAPEHICIGTATDPYQPAEREYGVTRACLEELAKYPGLSLSITTKSNLIARDIDVLQRIAKHSRIYVDITVTTLRSRLARILEPRAPRPDLRLEAIRKLREAGISVGAMASPLLPGITDRPGELEKVAQAAHDAGAQWFVSGVLFLMPSSARQFFPFLREKFPRLARQYQQWYERNAYAPEPYRQKIAERVARIKTRLGMTKRPWEEMKLPVREAAQLSLALSA